MTCPLPTSVGHVSLEPACASRSALDTVSYIKQSRDFVGLGGQHPCLVDNYVQIDGEYLPGQGGSDTLPSSGFAVVASVAAIPEYYIGDSSDCTQTDTTCELVSISCQTTSTGEFITMEHVNLVVQQKMGEIDSLRIELAALRSKSFLRSAEPPRNADTITQKLNSPKRMKARH